MNTAEILHKKFNPRSDQIPPSCIKGFKRADLYKLFAELGFGVGAEIGVADGRNALTICENVPGVKLYCVDLYDTYYRGTAKLKDKTMQDDAYRKAQERLSGHDTFFLPYSSMSVIFHYPGIDDVSLDFVYIDGDHSFDHVMSDLIWWSRKVKPGGIVSGSSKHDAYRFRGAGVVDAVSTYTHCHQINEWFVCDEREVSYFWAKP